MFALSRRLRSKTGIVYLNMGGPATQEEVQPFLRNLFTDKDIIKLGPFQSTLGPYIAKRRAPEVAKQYAQIGGGSPIRKWSELQGERCASLLDSLSPNTGPHKSYVGFRYAAPFIDEALLNMKKDGITRAVAFSQYPQWSCTTAGSSLNHLWKTLEELDMKDAFKWSIIDRWPTDPMFIDAVAENVKNGLARFPAEVRDDVVIAFSAHSLPQYVIDRGDTYSQEIAASVQAVMESKSIDMSNPYVLCWQSKVGFLPWLGPSTENVIKELGAKGHKNMLVVPIAFTSDHIETLFELDIEYGEVAHTAGITRYERADALNGSELFTKAQANIVKTHLESGEPHSVRYLQRCHACTNDKCRKIVNSI